MRRSHWAVIIVLVCVLASCQSALPPATPTPELTTTASPTATFVPAPTITATNTPSPEPTATQQPTPTCASEPTSPIPQEAKEYFSEAYRLWVDETQDPSNFLMASNLISGTLAYANAMLDPATPLEAQRDALDSLSAWMRYNPYCMESYESRISQSYLSLDLFDLDGDGRSEGVFVLNHDLMVGPPMELDFVLYGDGEQYTIYPLLPLVQYKDEHPYLCLLCHATVERVGDINRDGEWETQILLIILHADSAGYEPYILRWTPDDIEVLFGQEYRWWKQQVYWQVGDDGTIIVDEPYFDFYCELGGMLGANLCRRQITTYRWRDGAYRVDSTVVTPPQTTFQQLAIADEFLYAGQYDQALYAYRQLVHWAIPLSEPQGHPHGCRAIGWLRLGALYARLGDERNAQNAMIQAQAAYLDCASAYLATYAETDSTLDALFALWRTTEHTDYECAGVNIKPTLLCLEAYLVAHPHQAADEIFQGLNALGLEVTTVVEDDLNSDGLREVIIVQSGSDSYNTLWLLVQCGSDWMAIKIEFGEALTVEEIVDVPGTSARAVVFTCDKSCDYAAIGWDGHVPVFYKDTDTFEMAEPVGYYSYYRTGWDGRRCDH